MRRFLTIDQFAALTKEQRDSETAIATDSTGTPELGESGRVVSYVFSTPAVGRDLHTVANDAWQIENYLRNPVFLWAHDDSLPPIGRVTDIGVVNGALRGTVEYAERELNSFADTIYNLVRARYLNAVSTSWIPLDWSLSRDKARPGGADFREVELLEISQVPVPALPSALASARAAGIDTNPLSKWASRALDRRFRAVPRPQLEAIQRAARGRPAPTYTGAGGDDGRARRAARARALREAGRENDRALLAQYRNLRDSYGLSVDRIAFDLGTDAHTLMRTIERIERDV